MPTGDRTTWFDEHLAGDAGWWAGDEVDGLRLDARPRQDPLEVWLGGRAHEGARAGRAARRRLARRADDARGGRRRQGRHRRRPPPTAGRAISPEHFGTNLGYGPGLPPLREQIARWVDAGFTKLVVRPAEPPDDWVAELRRLADDVLDLQT